MCDNNELGTELHVIMKCENQDLIKIREHSLQCIHNYSPQIKSLNIRQKLDYILQGVAHDITLQFVFFLDKLYKLINKKEVDLKKK